MTVYVVTNVEMGWDCVCGVFSSIKSLAQYFFEDIEDEDVIEADYTTVSSIEADINDCYVIHEEELV